MDKRVFASVLAALATAVAIALFMLLALPVAKPIAWALIIGVATMPHYDHLNKRFPGHPSRAAGLMVLAVTICFILPAAYLVTTVATNAADWYKQIEELIQTFIGTGTNITNRIPLLGRAMSMAQNYGIDLPGMGAKAASGGSTYLLNAVTNFAKNLFSLLFTLAVALFVLYFVYRDGQRVVDTFLNRLASNQAKGQHYATEIRAITTAVTVGTLLTCVTQGLLAGLGYWVAGIPAALFCGALTAIAALIPVVGTALIWVPLVAVIALNGAYLKALLLTIWCVVFVGLSDNAIRPLAIGATSDISALAVVLGAICGVVTMGLLGLILGPLIFAIIFSIWDDVVSEIKPEENATS